MAKKISASDAKRLWEKLKKSRDNGSSRSIESGKVGVSGTGKVSADVRRILNLAATRRKMAEIGPRSARAHNIRSAEKLERQAASAQAAEKPAPTARPKSSGANGQSPYARGIGQGLGGTGFGYNVPPEAPPAAPPYAPPERPTRIMPLERRGVPNPQSLRRDDYQAFYGTDRDVSPAAAKEGGQIIQGPTALNHEGRLRRTGKVSGHWAMYAYLVNVDGTPTLGVKFKSGFRCFYPGTGESDYRAIVNSESGSYYAHDHLRGRGYVQF